MKALPSTYWMPFGSEWVNSHIRCALASTLRKSRCLRANPRRGIRLYPVIFEVRQDEEGEILHLVTLWRSTKEEVRLYEENS